jgi:hypothetical protein
MADAFVSTRPLIDKLGVKPLARVSVLGLKAEWFLTLLRERTPDVVNRARPESDLIFYAADSEKALERLAALKGSLRRDGALWVVSLKGRLARIRDVQVIAAAKAAGLVDNKVVAFSETRTSLRLVIPKALR